uniref:hypothetical protein n=1 Tax=Virgibacillus senegalensis TaxID=1499679 RepID=UPI001F2A7047|nr:hypothetical protein [Virgibacillus senegalensis]
MSNKAVRLSLRKRRYLCTSCGRTFYERLQMVDFYQRCTSALKTTALTYMAFHSFTTAARLAGMTTNRLLRLFDQQ